MTTQERIDVMLAADAGKKIQRCIKKSPYARGWEDCEKPGWNFYVFDYRVKPEPQTRTVYRLIYPDGSIKDILDRNEAIRWWAESIFNPTIQKIEIEL